MNEILLSSVMTGLGDESNYKIHFARYSGEYQPLDEYMADFSWWEGWNTYCKKDDFNRQFIFSLIDFYPEKSTWLFGGIWEIIDRDMAKVPNPYTIKLCAEYSEYIGRLKIKYDYRQRSTRVKLEKHFSKMVVKEILEEPFSTFVFPGYKNIDLPFKTLEQIIKKDAPEWRNALSVKGIYLITDVKTGKRYVGKADGEMGIWQRWNSYIENGHGGDVDLEKLVKNKGFEYVKENYKFAILEVVSGWEENNIDDRESHWKRVLLSRLKAFGHNKN